MKTARKMVAPGVVSRALVNKAFRVLFLVARVYSHRETYVGPDWVSESERLRFFLAVFFLGEFFGWYVK